MDDTQPSTSNTSLSPQTSFRAVCTDPPTLYRHRTESNPMPAPIYNTNINAMCEIFTYTGDQTKLVLVMVGIPARGKSFIARKIRSYLSWLGYNIQWFNIGQYRRSCAENTVGQASSHFFHPNNKESKRQRELFALLALSELEKYLMDGGQIAILDGTNSTLYRRKMIRNYFARPNGLEVKIVWIEPICNDERIIERNIRNVKMKSPDYADVPLEEAIADFKQRIKHYEQMYVPVGDNEGSYIKLIDAGKKVIGHKISGYLPARILYFLMHLNLKKVTHFFTQHGESFYNAEGRIGGDSDLSAQGKLYAKQMIDFISMQPQYIQQNLKVWCSTLQRSIKTAQVFLNSSKFKTEVLQWRALTDIEVGICDGMTYGEIAHKFPKEFANRKRDKLSYRYPQGESYKDCIKRLEPVIFELERSEQPVLVISHRAILRCLYGYFMDEPLDKIPYIPIELHSVYKLTPTDYSTDVDVIPFGMVSMKKYCVPAVVSNNEYRFDSPVISSVDQNVTHSNSDNDILVLDVHSSNFVLNEENENNDQSDEQEVSEV